MTWIKVCGITSVPDAAEAARAGVSAIGLVFANSPRQVGIEQALQIADSVRDRVEIVGVFKEPADIDSIHGTVRFDRIQIHGSGRPSASASLIRVVRPDDLNDDALPGDEDEGVTLIDGSEGRGLSFDWTRVRSLNGRFVIAGGLDPHNVGRAIAEARPFGVDVSSGVEKAPGRKDPARMVEFVEAVRRADAERE